MRELIETINELLKKERLVTVAIDGRCGSGKTTLAAKLFEMFACDVIHMDDFFLRPEQRSAERLAVPGENIDHERFLEEILLPLADGKSFSYRPFLCKSMDFGEEIFCRPEGLVVVEGSYSQHPSLRSYYDLCIFLDIEKDTQLKRIRKRSSDRVDDFVKKWIPLEEMYFDKFSVRDRADIVIMGDFNE